MKTLLRDPTTLAPGRSIPKSELTLLDVIDRILDKGVVINGDITVSFAGVDILSLKINLVIASFETAKRYGLEMPWEKWEREKSRLLSNEQPKTPSLADIRSPTQPSSESLAVIEARKEAGPKPSEQMP